MCLTISSVVVNKYRDYILRAPCAVPFSHNSESIASFRWSESDRFASAMENLESRTIEVTSTSSSDVSGRLVFSLGIFCATVLSVDEIFSKFTYY